MINVGSCVCVCVRARTLANLDKTNDDDEHERQELRRRKDVLDSRGRLHAVAVDKGQHHWGGGDKHP